MATYKRIDGDYHIVSINASDSIYLDTENAEISTLKSIYGKEFVAGFEVGNILGVQFHPEKSHKFGMKLLSNFSQL